jgi:hypothetical protein
MAAFPTYAKIASDGFNEAHSPTALRSDMERGMAKQRRTQSTATVTLQVTLLFMSKVDSAAFEDWYYSPTGAAHGAAFFDFTDPRTGVVRQARVVANSLGPLSTMGGSMLSRTKRTLQIEYLRAL